MHRFTVSPTGILQGGTALALAGFVASAGAAGYQIHEQSASAGANALAGAAAAAEDPTYMVFNPASIGHLDGNQVSGAISHIDPSFALEDAEATTTAGLPIGGDSGNGGKSVFVPAVMGKWEISDRVDVGLGVYSSFGLATEYDDDWIGRYHAQESELVTADVNPVVSFKATDRLTLAGGLIAQYADATLSSAVDFGSLGAANGVPGAAPANQDGQVEITGDDWGYGFNLGLLYEFNDRTRVGLGYRSKIDHTLTGDADFDYDEAGVGRLINASTGAFSQNADGSADLTTPAVINAGVYHELNDRWAVMAGVEWTRWSEFDELTVEFGDNTPDSTTTENWENTYLVSAGANYRLTGQWLLRGGIGYDESPVPDAEHRTPRIPDNDRRWLALGTTWTPMPALSLTGMWVHLFISDVRIDQNATPTNENSSRGNLSGRYEGEADLLSLQATYRF